MFSYILRTTFVDQRITAALQNVILMPFVTHLDIALEHIAISMIPPSVVQLESKIGEQTRPAGLAEESHSAEASVKTTLDNNQP